MSQPLHTRWTTWVGIALMLAAIATYVSTLDDSRDPLAGGAPAAQGDAP